MRSVFASTILALALLALAIPARAQDAPCTTPGYGGMDFWVGTWDLTWPGGQGGTPVGETGSGTNTITKALDGCVVRERFEGGGLVGESVSVYDATRGLWQQTWVDNQGGYLRFTGAPLEDATEGTLAIQTEPFTAPDGSTRINRMVWQNVMSDALTWRWQTTNDEGATWHDIWVVSYTRRADTDETP